MKTTHKIIIGDSRGMNEIETESIRLMITSPPYPMIGMWDEMFSEQSPKIKEALENNEGDQAFELINQELDKVWDEVYRVLKPGGIACINIGDATRTINTVFKLYPNHSRILSHCLKTGFQALPEILWRKQTNAPNKFMGSGMLPPGAYVTLEHEFILILRKGNKREFKTKEEKANRQKSSYFWEERNMWFSDTWSDLKGDKQKLNHKDLRDRSGAYPFELAYRLINMFSVQGDTILDPFLGTGTSTLGAMASGRDSIGIEIDNSFKPFIEQRLMDSGFFLRGYVEDRIKKHHEFVRQREEKKGSLKYTNNHYGFPVMTRQELTLEIPSVKNVERERDNEYIVSYDKYHSTSLFS